MADGITIAVVAVYCLAMIGIGIWSSKKVSCSADFLVAGRSLGFWVFILLMIGTVCSGMSLLGSSGLGFTYGWPTIWEQIFVPLSIAFCIIFFGVKLFAITKETGYITVQDYLAHRYESQVTLRALSAIAGILVSMIYLVGQFTAISIVLMWLFEIPLWLALVIAMVVVTLYTSIGGLYAVASAAFIHSMVLIVGVIIIAPLIIFYAGGFTHVNEVMASVNPSLVQPWLSEGMVFTPAYLVSFGILLMVGLACAPHVINNVLAVQDARLFVWAPLVAFLIYISAMFLLKFSGFAGIALVHEGAFSLPDVPNAQDFVILYGLQNSVPYVALWSIFAVIVLAAVMSTTDRLMITIGAMFSWDIYKNILRPQAPDDHVLRVSKVVVVLSAVLALVIALNPPEMLAFLIWMGIGVMLATFAVPLLAGLYWRRASRMGAISSMSAGLVAAGVFGGYYEFVEKLPLHFSFYAVIVSLVVMVMVSYCTKPTSEEVLDATKTGWFIRER